MALGTPDVYYQPEKFDLYPVAEIDYSDGNYQFDLRVVWKHTTGQLFTARDSGCSCPSPFEDYTKLTDLDPLDLVALKREIREELTSEWSHLNELDATRFVMRVIRA